MLKPGGTLGVVEHRLPESADDARQLPAATSRCRPSAGWPKPPASSSPASSEINANPKDTKDHPEGVWTLPPTYELGDKDRAKYAAIGESDRMTLKFVKPTP